MKVRPNQTLVTAIVRGVRPDAAGAGENVELEIQSNDTPQRNDDFLRPEPGSTLTAFSAQPLSLEPGTIVTAALSLAAGPFAQRTVLRELRPVPAKP
jgi:hypothetical protein